MCEVCPILQISYACAQRETQGAPQTLPFVFFWGRPIQVCTKPQQQANLPALDVGLSNSRQIDFSYFRCECSKRNRLQLPEKLGLMCLRKAGHTELRSTGSCLLFLEAMQCTL